MAVQFGAGSMLRAHAPANILHAHGQGKTIRLTCRRSLLGAPCPGVSAPMPCQNNGMRHLDGGAIRRRQHAPRACASAVVVGPPAVAASAALPTAPAHRRQSSSMRGKECAGRVLAAHARGRERLAGSEPRTPRAALALALWRHASDESEKKEKNTRVE